MDYVNLTPHTVRLNSGREYPPSGQVARVNATHEVSAWLSDGPNGPVSMGVVPIYRAAFGQVEGLPEPVPFTMYIVSGMVAAACRDREDVVAPATGHPETVRRDGRVWSVPGFSRG